MAQQLARQTQRTLISVKTSQQLLVKTVSISIQCIAYLRGLFHESLFVNDHLDHLLEDQQSSKKASRVHAPATRLGQSVMRLARQESCITEDFLDHLENGISDALQHGHLAALMFNISLESSSGSALYECYTFEFCYRDGEESINLRRLSEPASRLNHIKVLSADSAKQNLQQMCRQVILLTQSLNPIPEDVNRILSFKLFYKDSTPEVYQAPGFQSTGPAGHLHMLTRSKSDRPFTQKVASVDLHHHSCSMFITTLCDLPGIGANPVGQLRGWDAELIARNADSRLEPSSQKGIQHETATGTVGNVAVEDREFATSALNEDEKFRSLMQASLATNRDSTQILDTQDGSLLHSPAQHSTETDKHQHTYVEAPERSDIDCACGDNSEDGAMVACECCGAWAHLACYGFLTDPSSDYVHTCYGCTYAKLPVQLSIAEDLALLRHVLWNLWDSGFHHHSTKSFATDFHCSFETAEKLLRMLHADGWLVYKRPKANAPSKRQSGQVRMSGKQSAILKTSANQRRFDKLFDPAYGLEQDAGRPSVIHTQSEPSAQASMIRVDQSRADDKVTSRKRASGTSKLELEQPRKRATGVLASLSSPGLLA